MKLFVEEIDRLRTENAKLLAALKRLVNAAIPIKLWMGGANHPSYDEREEFVLALSEALAALESEP